MHLETNGKTNIQISIDRSYGAVMPLKVFLKEMKQGNYSE